MYALLAVQAWGELACTASQSASVRCDALLRALVESGLSVGVIRVLGRARWQGRTASAVWDAGQVNG